MLRLTAGSLFASLARPTLRVLGDASIRIVVAFVLAAAAAILLRRFSAAVRHAVWAGAMLAFALLPILSATLPSWGVLPRWSQPADAARTLLPSGTGPEGSSMEADARRGPPNREPEIGPPTAGTVSPKGASAEFLGISQKNNSASIYPGLTQAVFGLWLIGFGFLLMRTALSRYLLHRVLRSAEAIGPGPIGDEIDGLRRELGIGRRVDAFLSPRRDTPMTWGILRVRLLLPKGASDWDDRRLHAVLLHELSHVRRFDTVTHVLAQIVHAVYWFHPLVWAAARRLRAECERACDDLVLESGVKPSEYAEELLGILAPRVAPSAALALKGRCELEGRLRAILGEGVVRRPITRSGTVLAVMIAGLASAFLSSLRAGQPAPELNAVAPPAVTSPRLESRSPEEEVVVTCVDAEGNAVEGAEVHLFQYSAKAEGGRYVHSGPRLSGKDGKATCAAATNYDGEKHDRWIYARVPGRLVGVARSVKWANREAFNTANRVVLVPSQEIEGRVTVPANYDPKKVTVRVRNFLILTGPDVMDYEGFPREDHFPGLDRSLPEIFEAHPDADGRLHFGDVPVRGRLYLVSSAPGLAEAQWSNYRDREGRFAEPIRMDLEVEGVMSGRVLSPDGKPAVGVEVIARLSSSGRRRNAYLSSFRARTDEAGKFAIHGLPETELVLSLVHPEKSWTFRPLEDLLVRPHQDPALMLRMESGVLVSGLVRDPDGRPVEGAAVSAVAKRGGPGLSNDVTKADGRYELRLPAGSAHLYFNAIPAEFAYPEPQIFKHLKIGPASADIGDLDVTLQRRTK